MIKLIAFIFSLITISGRFFIIYKILQWLIFNYNNQKQNILEIQWVLCVLLLDLYLSSLDKVYDTYIYKENKNEP